tara:strand:+ start:9313 stop:9876 length:564 start_codon:yes stop_codon:yes gene_type:complete
MNIFVLSECPKQSAKWMLDKHVVKMPTESMQMLSTILTNLNIDAPYKPVMLNHPCTIWARESKHNFLWLMEHTMALCKEYTVRYGRKHKVEETYNEYEDKLYNASLLLPDIGLTEFAQAMPDECKRETITKSYQTYYLEKKWEFATWKTKEPIWWPKAHYVNMYAARQKQFEELKIKMRKKYANKRM